MLTTLRLKAEGGGCPYQTKVFPDVILIGYVCLERLRMENRKGTNEEIKKIRHPKEAIDKKLIKEQDIDCWGDLWQKIKAQGRRFLR